MTTQARLGYGTLLQRWTDGDWLTIAEQLKIDGPNLSSDDVEVTNHDSPGGIKEYIPALMDTGEVNFEGNFIPGNTSQQQLITDQKNRIVSDWRIVLPTADSIDNREKWSFQGYIKGLSFSSPVPSQMTISGTMKLAGEAILSSTYSADLTALVVTGSDSGALDPIPELTAEVYEYGYVAGADDASCTVTPTKAGGTFTLYVNNVVVASGQASAAISLNDGINHISVKVAETDKAPRLYALTVIKEEAVL